MEIDDEALERLLITAYHGGWQEGWDMADSGDILTKEIQAEARVYSTNHALHAVMSLHNRIVADGLGSEWVKCDRLDCGLGVTRPGSAGCYGYFPCNLEGTT